MNAVFFLALVTSLGQTSVVDDLPPPVPTGLQLLYGTTPIIGPTGEPTVTVGIAEHVTSVDLSARSGLEVEFFEGSVRKRSATAGRPLVRVTLRRSQPAKRSFYVVVGNIPQHLDDAKERLTGELIRWRERGFSDVQVIEDGAAFGVPGGVVDNRGYRVSLPVANLAAGKRLVVEIHRRFGERPKVVSRLLERPWGELELYINGMPVGLATSFVRITPDIGGALTIDDVEFGKGYSWHNREDRSYEGDIYVVVDADGRLSVVNAVGAERLVAGVVPSEIFASAHPESLKSQAVAARSILFSQLGKRHNDDPFHLCAAQHCQVYSGTSHEDPRTTAAAEATAGEVLFLGDRLVNALYSSTCGGHTEDNDVAWGDAPEAALRGRPDFDVGIAPELAEFSGGLGQSRVLSRWVRRRPTAFCARSGKAWASKFRWRKTLDAKTLKRLVGEQYRGVGRVIELVVKGRGPGGRARALEIVGSKRSVTVLYELPIRQLFGGLRSAAFDLEIDRTASGRIVSVTFVGGGWGHGVGMCQLGAIGRAQKGYAYREILAHYYNGATVKRLYGK